jgi:Na+-driven multidrug efflux pump
LATTDKNAAIIQSIAVSVNIFLMFAVAGLEKGALAITSNLLGAGLGHKISKVLKSGICIHFFFMCFIAILFLFYPELILKNFVKFDVPEKLTQDCCTVLRFVLIYMSFDGICWVIAGVIEGGGDINFTMLSIAGCIWGLVTIPAIALFNLGMLRTDIAWMMLIVAVIVITIILYRRYKSDKWIRIQV